MPFNFIRYIPSHPFVTIQPRGRIGFSRSAAKFAVKKATHLVLYFDTAKRSAGIEFTDHPEPYSFSIKRVGSNTYADVKRFIDACGIDHPATKRYLLRRDEASKLWYFVF